MEKLFFYLGKIFIYFFQFLCYNLIIENEA